MFYSLFRERRRSRAVRALPSFEAMAEPAIGRFVSSAASAFNAPIAALSLIHEDQQTVMAGCGFPIGGIPREEGFCRFTLDCLGVLECCNPQRDARFAGLPGVLGDPHIRYYVGAPLRLLSGVEVGALCVVDTAPRQPASQDQKAYLLGLARQAAIALECPLDLWGRPA